MSWKQNLQDNVFTITTGDGTTYTPLWRGAEKSVDFNATKFDFINVNGSFIDRKLPQSPNYPLVFWIQGDDYLDVAREFEQSAENPNPWTVNHPYYGVINGQPLSIQRSDQNQNVVEFVVDFWLSVDDDFPAEEISIQDEVRSKAENVNSLSTANYIENANPQTSDIAQVRESVAISGSRFTPDSNNFNEYRRITQTALSSVDELATNTAIAITNATLVISAPAQFDRSVRSKINSYKNAYENLKNDITNKHSKFFFETQGASVISGLSDSVVNPQEGDYVTRNDVIFANNELIAIYQDYVETLDSIQIGIQDIQNNWLPNSSVQQALIDLVTFASQSLFILSFDARQERTFITDSDTNLIVLTHRFLGLDANDENIEIFKRINQIQLNEIYRIRKGRQIRYFV